MKVASPFSACKSGGVKFLTNLLSGIRMREFSQFLLSLLLVPSILYFLCDLICCRISKRWIHLVQTLHLARWAPGSGSDSEPLLDSFSEHFPLICLTFKSRFGSRWISNMLPWWLVEWGLLNSCSQNKFILCFMAFLSVKYKKWVPKHHKRLGNLLPGF